MTDFIELTLDSEQEHFTNPMPADETVVEVQLENGTVRRAWYSRDIMEAGDFDFLPIEEGQDEPDLDCDSIADQVVAWRPLPVVQPAFI